MGKTKQTICNLWSSNIEKTINCKLKVIGTFEHSASDKFNNLSINYRKAESYTSFCGLTKKGLLDKVHTRICETL